jgi:hypothetical protein
MQLCHERAPQGWDKEKGVESVISRQELEEIGERYKQVAGFDVESVNQKAKKTAKAHSYGSQKTVVHESSSVVGMVDKVVTGVELS